MSSIQSDKPGGRKFTGWHFFLIMLSAFGVIITANVTLAYFALGSFPGLDVANTYVASQEFDAKRQAQEDLGWSSQVSYDDGVLILNLREDDGALVMPEKISIRIGSATTAQEDQTITPILHGDHYRALVALPHGNKMVFVTAMAKDGTIFTQRHTMVLP